MHERDLSERIIVVFGNSLQIFGYPTGIGALIVRHDSMELLKKNYFGGGTVRLMVPDDFSVFYKNDFSERLY